MHVVRYSAAKMFGVPIEDCHGFLPKKRDLPELMAAYDIEPTEIERGPTNITPFYWTGAKFTYYLTQLDPDGPAMVDLLPAEADAVVYALEVFSAGIRRALPNLQRIEIPTFQQSFVLAGGSPRFAGSVCLHEVITSID